MGNLTKALNTKVTKGSLIFLSIAVAVLLSNSIKAEQGIDRVWVGGIVTEVYANGTFLIDGNGPSRLWGVSANADWLRVRLLGTTVQCEDVGHVYSSGTRTNIVNCFVGSGFARETMSVSKEAIVAEEAFEICEETTGHFGSCLPS